MLQELARAIVADLAASSIRFSEKWMKASAGRVSHRPVARRAKVLLRKCGADGANGGPDHPRRLARNEFLRTAAMPVVAFFNTPGRAVYSGVTNSKAPRIRSRA